MDDDILVRAVTIGASVFITLATVTAVMMYYNTAKIAVTNVGSGTNIEEKYRQDIKNTLYNEVATGAEVRNILQYFSENYEVNISISSYYAYDASGAKKVIIDPGEVNRINHSKNNTYIQIMKTMMPNQKFKVTNIDQKYTFELIT